MTTLLTNVTIQKKTKAE